MKKKIIFRALFGVPLGIAISTIITIVISLVLNDGTYYAVVPELTEDCGNELNAVILQTILSMLYGAAWGGASVIWEKDDWSILRQSATHLIIAMSATFPIAYYARWMDHSLQGILIYVGIFIAIYLSIWLSQYKSLKRRIDLFNKKLTEE